MGDNPFVKKQQEVNSKKNECRFCPQIESLPVKRREQLHAAMLNTNISAPTIIQVLSEWGVLVGKSSLQSHRSGRQCADRVNKKWAKR